MLDDWDDWESENFVIPILNEVKNVEQLKKIEERRLVEEGDHALTYDLFQNKQPEIYSQVHKNNNFVEIKIEKKEKIKKISNQKANELKQKEKISNQKANELKQKELSKLIKQQKEKKDKEKELYGENDYDDEYSKYEDKFN